MASRTDLHLKLVSILGSDHVYFQPPESIKLQYPAFVYTRTSFPKKNADNTMYGHNVGYKVVYISRIADSEGIIKQVLETFPYSKYATPYVADNLYHDVFEIYI